MERKLTPDEIQHLFKVCENNGVYQYDVQIELVDHLASIIENYWIKKPEDPFKYAVYKAWKKFGSSGFLKVKNEKTRALVKKYNRMMWDYLLDFYRWPKMLLTLMLSLALAQFAQLTSEKTWLLIYIPTGILIAILAFYTYRYKSKIKTPSTPGKSFLLLKQSNLIQKIAQGVFTFAPFFLYILFDALEESEISLPGNFFILFLIALIVVSLNIVLLGYYFYIPQKIKEHFCQQFPEFAE